MNKKIIASVLAVAFAVSMVSSASAVTVEELQAQIATLLAQITSLQAQISGQTATTTGLCLSGDLSLGMTSAEVKTLQQGLNQDPATQVAVSGAGAPGYETSYFGALTKAAVIKFQDKYASEVLASWGISKGTGYAGSTTRAKFNALYCTPVTPTTTTLPGETTTTTTVVAPSYGSLSVTSYPVSNPQTTLYGGITYEAAAVQYKATGSDITIRKIPIEIVSAASTVFPWQAFTAVSIWDGSTMLVSVPVVQANLIENTFAKDYTLDISGLNIVVPNNTQKVLTVKVDAITNAVAAVTGTTFTVTILKTGVVNMDTAGVTYTAATGSDADSATLTLSAAQTSTITTTAATGNPVAGNVIGSKTATTKVDLLKFDVKVENVSLTFNSGSATLTDADLRVTSLELWDGATLIASDAPAAGVIAWTNFTLPIAAGTTKTLTLKANLIQFASDYDGTSTVAVSTGPVLTGIDTNSNVVTADGSAVTGATQYIYIEAPVFTYVSSSATVKGTDASHLSDIGDTSITFSVTASGSDMYIATKAKTATALQETLSGWVATTSTSTTWTCSAPGENTTNASYWRIPSGQTANCTYSTLVTNTGGTAGYYSVALDTVTWATTATTTGAIAQTWGLTNIKTADFYLGI